MQKAKVVMMQRKVIQYLLADLLNTKPDIRYYGGGRNSAGAVLTLVASKLFTHELAVDDELLASAWCLNCFHIHENRRQPYGAILRHCNRCLTSSEHTDTNAVARGLDILYSEVTTSMPRSHAIDRTQTAYPRYLFDMHVCLAMEVMADSSLSSLTARLNSLEWKINEIKEN